MSEGAVTFQTGTLDLDNTVIMPICITVLSTQQGTDFHGIIQKNCG